jgi:hypothetical protein
MEIHQALNELCRSITGKTPISVVARPEPWAEENYCFTTVARKISEDGGSGQLGWQFRHCPIGSSPGFLLAVHHQVWRSPGGELIDITPYAQDLIMLTTKEGTWFLPDDSATLEKPVGCKIGVSRPSKFYLLTKNRQVREIVRQARRGEWEYWSAVSKAMQSA